MKDIAIIGCGLIGKKRALAVGPQRVGALYDIDPDRAKRLSQELELEGVAVSRPEEVFKRPGISMVVVATDHRHLSEYACQALESGKHVLVEKPGAINRTSWERVIDHAQRFKGLVRVGFNHRYHPALQKAREIVDSGVMGPLFLIRGRYGHGGRLGYDKEWRADRSISGGGELMDQGVHLIDLSSWFLGPFESIQGSLATYFWKMPVEDNAFLNLRNRAGATAWLHATWTEWKNCFSFEIYGRDGKIHIEGLGGSYGTERLTYYQMLPEMGPPRATAFEYATPDVSFKAEMEAFFDDIRLGRVPSPGLEETRQTLRVVETVYQQCNA